MNELIKCILEKAALSYSEGIFYTLNQTEIDQIKDTLDITISKSELTDDIYDTIYYTAKQKWPKDQFFNQLQAEDTGFGKEIIHSEPMGSMDELKTGDWDKWKSKHKSFLLSDKLDGCSIILTYKCGKLFSVATRGKGIKGKDILRHAMHISNIPKEIKIDSNEFVVRGELICPKTEIKDMLNEVSEIEGKEQKNGRNTIAGALNRKESNLAVFKRAHFVAYWNSLDHGFAIDKLKDLGFEVPQNKVITVDTTEQDLINIVTDRIENSDYEIDGIILTQLDNPDDGLEAGTINPKCSRKFKIGIYNNIAESTITGITWQPSKDGRLTPVLQIEPIELCGATIINVTGHNYQNLIDKQCGIGSKVKISRAGLVIPYLKEVLTFSTDLNLPNNVYQEGVNLMLQDKSAKEVLVQRLVHFAKTLNLEQAGEASMEKLLDTNPQLKNPIFLLSFNEFMFTAVLGINGSKLYKSIQNVKDNISESKLADACGAFGSGIGESLLLQIEQKYGNLIPLKEEIDNFGPNRITQYNENYQNWLTIVSLYKSFGYKFKEIKKNLTLPLVGNVICFTGIRDKTFAEHLEQNGAVVTETFNKKVNVLIAKDITGNSSKITKAKEQGCQILSLDQAKIKFHQ